jgi:hypothetical protein
MLRWEVTQCSKSAVSAHGVLTFLLQAMRFAELATLLVVLLRAFGEVENERATHLQEDCAGVGNIACGARLFHLSAARRDVACLNCLWDFPIALKKTHKFDLETLWHRKTACVYIYIYDAV